MQLHTLVTVIVCKSREMIIGLKLTECIEFQCVTLLQNQDSVSVIYNYTKDKEFIVRTIKC
jgi:hypothetical protein